MKNKKILITFISILVICFGIYAFKAINNWYNTHYFEFKAPVQVNFFQPVAIKIRIPKIIIKDNTLLPVEIDTPIKEYICKVFGQFECKTAIAVALNEGLNHPKDGFNINTNGTIDVGYFRINSVHFKQKGCSMAEVITEKGNVDCAYSIWQASGWTPWVAYNNGNYLRSL